MNNSIKFRVWHKNRKKFYYLDDDYSLDLSNDGFYLIGPDHEGPGGIIGNKENCVLQQFTGLLDKNKNEIYEGDVVKFNPKHELVFIGKNNLQQYTHGIILWVNYGFNVCQKYLGRTSLEEFTTCDCHPCALEIIGNIFENPELLHKN